MRYLAHVQMGLVAAAPAGVGGGVGTIAAGAGVDNLDLHGSLAILAKARAVHLLAIPVRDDCRSAGHLQALPADSQGSNCENCSEF